MKAVIFDCDGVLIDSEVALLAVELECLAEIGLTYDHALFVETFLGQTNAAFHDGLEADHRKRFGRPLPADFIATLAARVIGRAEAGFDVVPGAVAAVAAVALPKAVASSSPLVWIERKLRRAGLFDAFAPHIYSGEQVARGKPAPDIYIHAASALGIEAMHCVAVEDSVNGVRAAIAAGMIAVGFTGGGHCPPSHGARLREAGAAAVVTEMGGLLKTLAAL